MTDQRDMFHQILNTCKNILKCQRISAPCEFSLSGNSFAASFSCLCLHMSMWPQNPLNVNMHIFHNRNPKYGGGKKDLTQANPLYGLLPQQLVLLHLYPQHFLLKPCPAFMDSSDLQNSLQRDSGNQFLKQAKVQLLETQFCWHLL